MSDLLIILCYLAIVFAVCVVADILVKQEENTSFHTTRNKNERKRNLPLRSR